MSQSVNTCFLFSSMLVHWNETETNEKLSVTVTLNYKIQNCEEEI